MMLKIISYEIIETLASKVNKSLTTEERTIQLLTKLESINVKFNRSFLKLKFNVD